MPPPERFGRYEVVRELGRGGMAVVYLARDPRVGRDVAIKVISADLAGDAEFRRRFDREAQALARLEHSAIVPLYDHGEEDGTPYLVFRYMEGGSLAERIARSGPLPLEDVAAIARRVGAALDYAHRREVIHRDIKPANILFDGNGEAWLGDFGISLAAERTSSLTSGAWIGSPAYMSPEQANGDPATAASDVYSLGCTLFEAVTGSPPFMAEKPVALLLKHVQEQPSRASERRADVPDAVDRALARALAKEPGERTPSGGKLAEALAGAVSPVRHVSVVLPPNAQGHGSSLPTIASSVDTGPLSGDLTRAVPEGASPLPTVAEPVVVAPNRSRWRPWWMFAGLIGVGLAGAAAASVFALAGGDDDSEKKAGVSRSPSATATSFRTVIASATRSSSALPEAASPSPPVEGLISKTPTPPATVSVPTATAAATADERFLRVDNVSMEYDRLGEITFFVTGFISDTRWPHYEIQLRAKSVFPNGDSDSMEIRLPLDDSGEFNVRGTDDCISNQGRTDYSNGYPQVILPVVHYDSLVLVGFDDRWTQYEDVDQYPLNYSIDCSQFPTVTLRTYANGLVADWTLGKEAFPLDPPAWLQAQFTLSDITPPLTDGANDFSVHEVSSDYFDNVGPFADGGRHTTLLPVTCDDIWQMVDESRMGVRSAEFGRVARSLSVAVFVGLVVRGPAGSEGYAGAELSLFNCRR